MAKKINLEIMGKDIYFFRSLANCGHISDYNYKHYINPTKNNLKEENKDKIDSRIKTYLQQGIIKQVADTRTNQIYYKYTDRGERYVKSLEFRKEQSILNFQKAAQYPYHDNKIAEKYFSLSREQQNEWKNESQLREEFNNYIRDLKAIDFEKANGLEERYSSNYKGADKISTPDGKWGSETGVETCWEAITDSYGQLDIIAKENFTTIMHYEIEYSER